MVATEGLVDGLGRGWVALTDTSTDGVIAYVSVPDRRVYVDAMWRDRAHFLLGAYTSVSTGHWRLPLPGDDARAPIAPGDADREFDAVDLRELPDGHAPAPGDMRVRRGAVVSADLSVRCRRISGALPVENASKEAAETARAGGAAGTTADGGQSGVWISGGPWTVPGVRAAPAGEEGGREGEGGREVDGRGGREVFERIGEAHRHVRNDCADSGAPVEVFGWRHEPVRGGTGRVR